MKLWEYRIKQYTYNLEDKNIQKRSRQNYEVEEILSDFGKEGYELVNVITEPILDDLTSICSAVKFVGSFSSYSDILFPAQ